MTTITTSKTRQIIWRSRSTIWKTSIFMERWNKDGGTSCWLPSISRTSGGIFLENLKLVKIHSSKSIKHSFQSREGIRYWNCECKQLQYFSKNDQACGHASLLEEKWIILFFLCKSAPPLFLSLKKVTSLKRLKSFVAAPHIIPTC